MKKLLLLGALAIGALTANAQDINVTVHGNPVTDGESVEVSCLQTEVNEFNGMVFVDYALYPEVKVTTTKDMELTITVYNTSPTNYTDLNFCWPSTCMAVPFEGSLTRDGMAYANQTADLGIESAFVSELPEGGLMLSCKVEINERGTRNGGVTFNLTMTGNADDNAVEAVAAEEGDAVYYDLQGRKVVNPDHGIYIVNGKKVVK